MSLRALTLLALLAAVVPASWLPAQVVLTGRLNHPRFPGDTERMALSTAQVFASRDGSDSQAMGFRTWETEPAGWYHMTGSAGRYTVLFTGPAHYIRPTILTNQFLADGDVVDRRVMPEFDYAIFDDHHWDGKAAREYFQPFVARGTSVTQIGFRPVHDGVDGVGPAKQDVLLSIHRGGEGTPDRWPQVGPTLLVPEVDCGGAKGYWFSGGFNSGEVPTTPGQTYAVRVRPANPEGRMQMFWHPGEPAGTAVKKGDDKDEKSDKAPTLAGCFRVGTDGQGQQTDNPIWMAVASDHDGVLVPYNKRVHRKFANLTNSRKKWSQTYVAQGRSLAGVIVYAAVSGAQPPLSRQRVAVRVREGGRDGRLVGREKIAIGDGAYTGDASWGMFGVVFSPGEVPLEPGKTYAIEMESIENYETLHGFVNIKDQVSNGQPGFTPYRKDELDDYPHGTSWRDGREKMDFDLDMQILEYKHEGGDWSTAVEPNNLLDNGDMQAGTLDKDDSSQGNPRGWSPFATDAKTTHHYLTDGADAENRILRVAGSDTGETTIGKKPAGSTLDGGFVAAVEGLSRLETYRLAGKYRSSWPPDEAHQCLIGIDPTGQTDDPQAKTIVWTKLGGYHGAFLPYASDPVRPQKDRLSIWLRGVATKKKPDVALTADFDDFRLQQVRTGAPVKKD